MKYLYLVPVIIFLYFSYLQFNDPDTWLWVGVYCAGAVISLLAIFKRYNKWVTLGATAIYAILAVVIGVGVEHWALSDEETREAGGLAVSAGCMLMVLLIESKRG